MNQPHPALAPAVRRGIAVLFVLVLASLVWTTRYAHPTADDYCYAVKAEREGSALAAIEDEYVHWGGRYSAVASMSLFSAHADLVEHFWILCLGLIGFSLFALRSFFMVLSRIADVPRAANMWVALYFCIYFAGIPSLSENLYWMAGGVTYTGGYAGLLLVVAQMLRLSAISEALSARVLRSIGVGGLVVAVAGFHEVSAFLQVCALAVGSALTIWTRHRSRALWIGATLLAVAGLVTVALAPGNTVRAAGFDGGGSLWTTLAYGLLHGAIAIAAGVAVMYLLTANRWVAPQTQALMVALGTRLRSLDRPTRIALGLSIFGLYAASFMPSYWGTGAYPVARTLTILPVLAVASWIPLLALMYSFGWIDRAHLPVLTRARSEPTWVAVAVLLALLASPNIRELMRDAVRYGPRFDRELNARYEQIHSALDAGQRSLTVLALSETPHSLFVSDIGEDPSAWRNRCLCDFYGLDSIEAITRHEWARRAAAPSAGSTGADSAAR